MLKLVPWPRQIERLDGLVNVGEEIVLQVPNGPQAGAGRGVAEVLERDVTELGFRVGSCAESGVVVCLEIADDQTAAAESYRLVVGETIRIVAATADGLFWGTRTLLQLLAEGPGCDVPVLKISDEPDFAYRGLLIDNARSFHPIDFHLRMIRRMSAYKLNRYHVHWSDQESYTLASEAFGRLPTAGRHHTREEIARLVQAAQDYHVMLVPEIDVPGHAGALTLGIDAMRCTHAHPGVGVICLGSDAGREALRCLFDEVMTMIPGDYWHLGADEVNFGAYDGCTACTARREKLNLPDQHALYREFINDMHNFVSGRGRTMLVWEGFDPGGEPAIHRDVVVCPFDVRDTGKLPGDYLDHGYTLLNTAWSPLYVADHYCMTTPEDIARWDPYRFGSGLSPTPPGYWHRYDPPQAIIGGQMCSWNNEPDVEESLLFGDLPGRGDYGRPGPRLPIVAERVWGGLRTERTDLLQRVGTAWW